jgi:hypothetical protein
MEVIDARERQVVQDAGSSARAQTGWLLMYAVLAVIALLCALDGVPGVPLAVWWVLVGALAAEVAAAGWSALVAWVELGRVRRCPRCRTAAMQLDTAWAQWRRCVRSQHRVEHDPGRGEPA